MPRYGQGERVRTRDGREGVLEGIAHHHALARDYPGGGDYYYLRDERGVLHTVAEETIARRLPQRKTMALREPPPPGGTGTDFFTWPEVMAYARHGLPLYYKAPLDKRAVRIEYEVKARSLKVFPPGSRGRGKARTADPFTAGKGHLERMRRESGRPEDAAFDADRGRRVAELGRSRVDREEREGMLGHPAHRARAPYTTEQLREREREGEHAREAEEREGEHAREEMRRARGQYTEREIDAIRRETHHAPRGEWEPVTHKGREIGRIQLVADDVYRWERTGGDSGITERGERAARELVVADFRRGER